MPKESFFDAMNRTVKTPLLEANFSLPEVTTLCNLLFQRFRDASKQDTVDFYDFLISMSILTRISSREKVGCLLEVMDVDEDKCLSIDEVFKMICTIEKNFIIYTNQFTITNSALL
jgi:Ca2+-binding EF-hand superfamily protein